MSKIHEAAKQSLEFAKEMMKKYADAHRGPTPVYTVGQKVWLEGKNISSLQPSQKLDDQCYGPFEIIKKVSPTTYQLKLPPQWGIHDVFHVSLLRPVHEDFTVHPNPYPRPPPEIIDDEERWPVERILKYVKRGTGGQYLIQWEGFPREEASWEAASEVKKTAPDAVWDFHRRHPEISGPGILSKSSSSRRRRRKARTVTFEEPTLQVKRLSDEAHLPTKGSALAARYDLYSAEAGVIPTQGTALLDTKLAIALPEGTYGHIAPCSGLASKFMINVGAGVIDADYHGSIKVLLFNHSDNSFTVQKGDRITQLIIEKIASVPITETDSLDHTVRGDAGFGSTGPA